MSTAIGSLLAGLLALAVAVWVYLRREGLDRRAWPLILSRAVALGGITVLLLDLSCGVRPFGARPLVLLDGSLSMQVAGGQWRVASDSAVRWGAVRTFGDEQTADTLPDRGASRLKDALVAAQAEGRQVIVVTDGELDDLSAIPSDLLGAARIQVFPRRPLPDFFVSGISLSDRISLDDTIEVTATIGRSGTTLDSATVELGASAPLLTRVVHFGSAAEASLRLQLPARRVGAGDRLLRVSVRASGDSEPRDDQRWTLVHVAETPGIVLLAAPPDWESRQLYRTLHEVSGLPVKGFVRFGAEWRTMDALVPASAAVVANAARHADLLVTSGSPGPEVTRLDARARWTWPAGEDGTTPLEGDWYVVTGEPSPLSAAWVDTPLDSLPPLTEISPVEPRAGEWVALSAREGRRGAARPVLFGREVGGRRELRVAGEGFWRWAFRGGASAEAYRTWVATATSWLLAATDPAAGKARPVSAVVARGIPFTFEWTGRGAPEPLAVSWAGDSVTRTDTLHFDGAGRASVRLSVGEYRYRLADGGAGVAAVEPWSREWIPRAPVLQSREGAGPGAASTPRGARDRLWLFALVLLALSTEWTLRRRRGLR